MNVGCEETSFSTDFGGGSHATSRCTTVMESPNANPNRVKDKKWFPWLISRQNRLQNSFEFDTL